jgi:hypothetical protein
MYGEHALFGWMLLITSPFWIGMLCIINKEMFGPKPWDLQGWKMWYHKADARAKAKGYRVEYKRHCRRCVGIHAPSCTFYDSYERIVHKK